MIGTRWKYSNVLSRGVLIGRVPARNTVHRTNYSECLLKISICDSPVNENSCGAIYIEYGNEVKNGTGPIPQEVVDGLR